MSNSGRNLDKNSVWLSGPAPFFENYIKLNFYAKHLKMGLNRVGEICGALFSN